MPAQPRTLAALLLAVGLGAPGALAATEPGRTEGARPGWARTCAGADADRQCLLTLRQTYANLRGGRNEMSVTLRRKSSCTTLHVSFDAPIELDRPVWITIDGGERHAFYRESDLTRLARAVDDRQEPAWGPEEFRGFYAEVRDGRVASAGTELVARFARVKDTRQLGLACAATERLMPELARGRVLTIEFHAESKGGEEPYHWPRMAARRVAVPLEGLVHALDSVEVRD